MRLGPASLKPPGTGQSLRGPQAGHIDPLRHNSNIHWGTEAAGGDGKNAMRQNAPTDTDIECPKCGRHMQVRTASTGVFLGCSGYALPPSMWSVVGEMNGTSDADAILSAPLDRPILWQRGYG